MKPKSRKQQLLQYVEDCVVDCIEDGIHDKTMTPKEGEWVYRMVGRRGLRGLINRWLGPSEVEKQPMLERVLLYKGGKDDDHPEGCVIPREVIAEAVKDHSKAVSIVTFSDDKLNVLFRETFADDDGVDPEALYELMEEQKNYPTIVYLNSKAAAGQPFIVTGPENDPEMLAFLQGDESVVPDITKKLNKFRTVSDTFDEFWDMSAAAGPALLDMLKDNSALLLFGKNGAVQEIDKDCAVETPWGTYYGKSEPVGGGTPVRAADEHKGKPSVPSLGKKHSAQPDAAAAEAVDTRKEIIKPKNTPMAKLRPDDISAFRTKFQGRCNDNGTLLWHDQKYEDYFVADKKQDKDKIIKDYEEMWGFVPLNWADGPIVPATLLIKEKRVSLEALRSSTAPGAVTKDLTTKNIPPSMQLTSEVVNKLKADVAKIFGSGAEQIANPATLKKEMAGIKTVAEHLGREKTSDVFVTSFLGRKWLTENHPVAAANLLGEVQLLSVIKDEYIAELQEGSRKKDEDLLKKDEEIAALKSALASGTRVEPTKQRTLSSKKA